MAEFYTLEQRAQGAEILKDKLAEIGIKGEVRVRPSPNDPTKDSAAVLVNDDTGNAVCRITINAKGFTNIADVYEDGDAKVYTRVQKALDLKPSQYTVTKPQPGSFLKQALRAK